MITANHSTSPDQWPELDDISAAAQADLARTLRASIDQKTKPLGALGQLEDLALHLGLILGTEKPRLVNPQMVVYAADHGIAAQGVSAYPSAVTWQMVQNFLNGGAAVSVLARQHGLSLTVVNCGVERGFDPHPQLRNLSIAPGTKDSTQMPAMTKEQCWQALHNGRELVQQLPGNTLLLGEMGIGNTSSAAMLLARLGQLPIADCAGAGTGVEGPAFAHKVRMLDQALTRHADAQEPLDALAALGGFEIATMVGSIWQAARERRVIVVDGFITGAAVLVARALWPRVLQRCVFAHLSAERGHTLMLERLQAKPLLHLGLRLGEGSGAALAWPLLQSACVVINEMASFASASVSQAVDAAIAK